MQFINSFRVAAAIVASTFSGLFSATGGTATVTSAVRTYTLGAGNSGTIQFTSVFLAAGTLMYSINGGSYVGNDITEGLTVVLAASDTLTIRASGLASTEQNGATLKDYDTNTVIEAVTLTRT